MAESERSPIEQAFDQLRQELGIRSGFPDDVLHEAERVAREKDPAASPAHADRTDVPFVTIDPPGSRDLDQALHLERAGDGFRVRYAIADVGFWVERGGAIEREAWQRGVTFYAPDHRESLYPTSLSEGAASLLPDQVTPAVLFTMELDARAEPRSTAVERARVRSRAQLTYEQALDHIEGGGKRFAGEEWAESLVLLREFGELRRQREAERGGTSLPAQDQHVQKQAAARLGYQLEYEGPNPAEEWNAQLSLLTGHVAAQRMLEARVGLLRTMPPADPEDVAKFRRAAAALGFPWADEASYAEFIRSLDLKNPHLPALLWQARRLNHGADYVAFDGDPPENTQHSALAWEYAHATAPLRRLADRYVLDLLATLGAGNRPSPEEVATLCALPKVMNEAETRAAKLERRAVDVAEAWTLRGCEGRVYPATVLGFRNGHDVEVQLENPPVRAVAKREGTEPRLEPGEPVQVRVAGVDATKGEVRFEVAG
ncbi:MAG: RNB domain-containing ribonuclease [Gemmatimonadetes bacterium]|nr:RNB domain-containing ribonuclease [Gemmatimonadota bacterium]